MNPQALLPRGSALAAAMPRRWAEWLADRAGDVSGRLSPRAYRQIQANLRQVLGREVSPECVRGAFRTYARYYLAMMRLARCDPEQAVGALRMLGRENLQASLERGNGALILSAHFGNWDVAGIGLAREFGGLCVFVEALQPESVLRFYSSARQRHGVQVVTAGSSSRLPYETLRRNALLGLVADRALGVQQTRVGCGRGELQVATGGIRLALRLGAAIHCVFARHEEGGFIVDVGPDLSPRARAGDRDWSTHQVAQAFANALAHQVRMHPEQWCLLHPIQGAGETLLGQRGVA